MDKKEHLCGLYYRVSTDDQAKVKEGSLTNQKERLLAFVNNKRILTQESATWIIVKEYCEEGRSAKDTVNRPKFMEMRRDIENGLINTVIFTDISRLSRSTRDFLEFSDFLKKHESHFICISNEGIDTSSDVGRTIYTILTALMEFELNTVRKRGKDAYHARRARGNWQGGYLYGYDLGKENGTLTINEQETKVVRYIFNQYLKEQSIYQVAARCSQMGYRTKEYKSRSGKTHPSKPFCYSSIRQIITNPAYMAKITLSDGRIITTEKWKPIISESVFGKVRELLEKNAKCKGSTPHSSSNYEYLLTELLRCFCCDTPMTTSSTRKNGSHHPYYVHRRGNRKMECKLPCNIPAQRLDDVIWDRLAVLVEEHFDEPVMRGVFASHKQSEPENIIAINNQIDEIRTAIRKKQSEHDNIIRNLGQNIQVAGSRVADVLKSYSDDVNELQNQIEDIESRRKELVQETSIGSQLERILQHKRKSLGQLSFQKKKEIAHVFLSQIILKDDHVILETRSSIASPIIGLLKTRVGYRSHPLSYIDVEWL